MSAILRTALRGRDRLVALSVLDQDACLYGLAALLALGTILLGESADYRQWAEMALGPYAVGAASVLLGGAPGGHTARRRPCPRAIEFATA